VRHLVAKELELSDGGKRQVMTDQSLAELLGIHVQTMKQRKQRPEIKAAVAAQLEEIRENKDLFKACMRHRALEELYRNYEKASGAEKRQYLKMILDQTEDVDEGPDTVDYSELSDEDLVNKALQRGVSVMGMTAAQLKRLTEKGASCSKSSQEQSSSEPDAQVATTSEDSPSEKAGTPETEPQKAASPSKT
jgi:hypothetical protein